MKIFCGNLRCKVINMNHIGRGCFHADIRRAGIHGCQIRQKQLTVAFKTNKHVMLFASIYLKRNEISTRNSKYTQKFDFKNFKNIKMNDFLFKFCNFPFLFLKLQGILKKEKSEKCQAK